MAAVSIDRSRVHVPLAIHPYHQDGQQTSAASIAASPCGETAIARWLATLWGGLRLDGQALRTKTAPVVWRGLSWTVPGRVRGNPCILVLLDLARLSRDKSYPIRRPSAAFSMVLIMNFPQKPFDRQRLMAPDGNFRPRFGFVRQTQTAFASIALAGMARGIGLKSGVWPRPCPCLLLSPFGNALVPGLT
jgi:hypothetical protein